MKLVYITADNPHEWNSSEWRCAVPARAINRSGLGTATLIDLPQRRSSICENGWSGLRPPRRPAGTPRSW